MSVNFPLFLVLATGLTGIIWVFDAFFLRPKRVFAADSLGQRTDKAEEAVKRVLKEPVFVEYSISFFSRTAYRTCATLIPGGTIPDSIGFDDSHA